MAQPCASVISKAMISKAMIIDKVTAAGLDDAQVFEAVRFSDLEDMIPGRAFASLRHQLRCQQGR